MFYVGICPQCGEPVSAPPEAIAQDFVECTSCGYCAPPGEFSEEDELD